MGFSWLQMQNYGNGVVILSPRPWSEDPFGKLWPDFLAQLEVPGGTFGRTLIEERAPKGKF